LQNLRQADRSLKWSCPACSASIDCEYPYCVQCGYGLPKIPRPRALTIGTTLLFAVIGFPAGLIAVYSFGYILGGIHELEPICIVSLLVCFALLRLMLVMSEGTRKGL